MIKLSYIRAHGFAFEPVRQTARPLMPEDLDLFLSLCDASEHDGKRIRVYSGLGFVARSYRWPCEIQYIERDRDGERVRVAWTGAQRAYGDGPHATIANRKVA